MPQAADSRSAHGPTAPLEPMRPARRSDIPHSGTSPERDGRAVVSVIPRSYAAAAIRMTCTSPDVPDHRELARRIDSVRDDADPLKVVWNTWHKPKPSKPAIAAYLWPVMEAESETILQR